MHTIPIFLVIHTIIKPHYPCPPTPLERPIMHTYLPLPLVNPCLPSLLSHTTISHKHLTPSTSIFPFWILFTISFPFPSSFILFTFIHATLRSSSLPRGRWRPPSPIATFCPHQEGPTAAGRASSVHAMRDTQHQTVQSYQ